MARSQTIAFFVAVAMGCPFAAHAQPLTPYLQQNYSCQVYGILDPSRPERSKEFLITVDSRRSLAEQSITLSENLGPNETASGWVLTLAPAQMHPNLRELPEPILNNRTAIELTFSRSTDQCEGPGCSCHALGSLGASLGCRMIESEPYYLQATVWCTPVANQGL